MPLNILECTGQPLQQRINQSQMSVLWWLRNSVLENGSEMISADEQ